MGYERKLSSEEATGKFVFILKDALKNFPQPGESFTLQVGNRKYNTQIKAIPCSCVGTPHEHYHLPVNGIPELSNLEKGNVISVKKLSNNAFSILVKSEV